MKGQVGEMKVEDDNFTSGKIELQAEGLVFERINGKLCFWCHEYPEKYKRLRRN